VWVCCLKPLRCIERRPHLPFSVARLCIFFKCTIKSHFVFYFSA
jgi:hypothetical protein